VEQHIQIHLTLRPHGYDKWFYTGRPNNRFRRLGGPLNLSGRYGEEEISLLLPESNYGLTVHSQSLFRLSHPGGRAIAEAVSRWLPTAEARVQSRLWSSGICGGQSGAGAGFLRVLRFPLPFIQPNSPSSQSPGAGTIGQ
jgi:hypothetical protein